MEFQESKKPYGLACLVGVVCTLLYFSLDCIVYPQIKWKLLTIRVISAIFIGVMWWLIRRSKPLIREKLAITTAIGIAFGISLMCFFSDEGFSSPYYVGNIMVMLVITVFFHFNTMYYTIIVVGIIIQHCIILSFSPWEPKYLAITLFFMCGIAVPGIIIHRFIYKILKEIRTLKEFLPICMYCKKIRDDKGYWNQVEQYVSLHTDTSFSHGICPECYKKLQEQIDKMDI